ncbi:MAG TPA: hypothetical protein VF179_10880 [Thermoanaerobaculia bacterium]|nr:hypothetical protein [Thermoanaerobaculia bacterium]
MKEKTFLFFVLAALLSPCLQAASLVEVEKPRIAVEFKIEASDFKENLGDTRSDVERRMAGELAKLLNKLDFVTWLSGSPADPSLAAILTISLEGSPNGPAEHIWLRLKGAILEKGRRFDCVKGKPVGDIPGNLSDLDERLYLGEEYQPSGNKDGKLETDLKDRFRTWFVDGSDFANELEKLFLSLIPIGRSAEPLVKDELVVLLDFREETLKAREGTKMAVQLCSHVPGYSPGPVVLTLRKGKSKSTAAKWKDLVQAPVIGFAYVGIEEDRWHPLIPKVFNTRSDKTPLDVLMIDFNRSYACTSGTSAQAANCN